MSGRQEAATTASDDAAVSAMWRIVQRGGEVVATNNVTGEVWQSSSMFAVCMSIAAGGNDLHAPADWLRFLSEWMTAAAEEEDCH